MQEDKQSNADCLLLLLFAFSIYLFEGGSGLERLSSPALIYSVALLAAEVCVFCGTGRPLE